MVWPPVFLALCSLFCSIGILRAQEDTPETIQAPVGIPPPGIPQIPSDLVELDQEVEASSPEIASISTFDNVTLKKCNGEQYFLIKLVAVLQKQGIYEEYQKNKCNSDYHDNCGRSWKGCNTQHAKIFCPKTCKQTNCYQLLLYGYTNADERATFTSDNDDRKIDCKYLAERGDCFSNALLMSDLCPESCRYTRADKDYLPYMPEEHKMSRFFKHYEYGKYFLIHKYIEYKKTVLHLKSVRGACGSSSVSTPGSSNATENSTSFEPLNGCPSSQNLTWFYKNWTTGGVHDYYIDKGRKDSLAECVDECASQDDCYYATMTTRSRVCYIMTTTSSVACQTAVPSGHFGDHLESCDPLHPCPSAYKICDKPRCSLLDILKSYCLSHDLDDALQGCSA